MACLSVRTGLDLLLAALALDGGDEVLVSAVTHPDMVRIEAHGLRAIPVDVEAATLAPRRESLEMALTSRSRVLLVAHLFGGRVGLAPLAAFTREHGLLLVEDCAQAFHGPEKMGAPEADVSMYSFGPIKTATALGGAVLRVRDERLLVRMRSAEESLPVQPHGEYLAKLLKFVCLILLARPVPYGLLAWACRLVGGDFDGLFDVLWSEEFTRTEVVRLMLSTPKL